MRGKCPASLLCGKVVKEAQDTLGELLGIESSKKRLAALLFYVPLIPRVYVGCARLTMMGTSVASTGAGVFCPKSSLESTTLKTGSIVLTVCVREMATAAKDRLAAMCPIACMEAGQKMLVNSALLIGCNKNKISALMEFCYIMLTEKVIAFLHSLTLMQDLMTLSFD